jgi:hypothetical protein
VTGLAGAPTVTVVRDPNQLFYDKEEDVTVAVQNDTSEPLSSVQIGVAGSGDELFAFDGDGLCSIQITPKPAECPFNKESGSLGATYDGPDTMLRRESPDAGTVVFPTPLKPGQYTYFSLEAPPTAALAAGKVNDTVSTTLTNTQTHATGVALAAPAPAPVTDRATVKGVHGKEAAGTVEYVLYSDPSCTKVAELLGTKNVVGGVAEASNPSSAALPTNTTYFWVAKYSGDVTNSPNSSGCGSETMSFGTPPPPPRVGGHSPGTIGGALTMLGVHLNESNGQITITAQLPGAGLLTANGVVRQGATLARVTSTSAEAARHKKCKRGYVIKQGRCVNNASVVYGVAALSAGSAGTYTLVIKPSKRVLEALRKGKRPLVTVSVIFQPLPSGTELGATKTLVAKVKKPKHHKH